MLNHRTTRRSFVAGGLGMGGMLFLDRSNLSLLPRNADYAAFREYQAGYEYLSGEEQDELLGERWSEYLPYKRRAMGNEDGRLCEIRVELREPTLLSLELQTRLDPHVSLPTFEIEHNEDEDRMLAPVLQTRYHDRQSFLYGYIPAGEHVFTVHQTITSKDIPPEGVLMRPYIPHGSPFYEALLAAHPFFAMRGDTFQAYMNEDLSDGDRRKAMMEGLLFFQRGFLRRNLDGLVRYEAWNGFTGEKGGHGKDPLKLMQKTQSKDKSGKRVPGRVYDYDTGAIITFNDQNEIVEIVRQYDRSEAKHQFEPPVLTAPEGMSPFDEIYPHYKRFQIVPDHGLVDVGMTYYEKATKQVMKLTRFTSLAPQFFVKGEEYDYLQQEAERGERIIALRTNLEWINDSLRVLNQYRGSFFQAASTSGEITRLTRTRIVLEGELDRLQSLAK